MILYLFVIVYILAINVYAFLFVKTLAKQERDAQTQALAVPVSAVPAAVSTTATDPATASTAAKNEAEAKQNAVQATAKTPQSEKNEQSVAYQKAQKYVGKLCITGALGGAIAIYACMFIFKFRRNDLFLMVIMPLLGVLNIYMCVLLFRSGFRFLLIR